MLDCDTINEISTNEEFLMAKDRNDVDFFCNGSEHAEQMQLLHNTARFIEPHHPEACLIYHIPNGGSRGETRASARRAGAEMKQAGAKSGVPDLHLPVARRCWHGLYIELKKPDGSGKLSDEQVWFVKKLSEQGYLVGICDNWRDAYELIRMYLALSAVTTEELIEKCAVPECSSFRVFDPKDYFGKYGRSKARKARKTH